MRTSYIRIAPHSKIDSQKANASHNDTAEDIVDLYRSYIDLRNDVEVQNIINPLNLDSVNLQIASLNTILSNLTGNITIISFYGNNTGIIYPSSINTLFQCKHEPIYGEVVLPNSAVEIEYHFIDPITGARSMIQNIDDYIESFITNNRYKPKVNAIYENAKSNAVNQLTNKSYIVRTLTTNAETDNISLVYNIETQTTKEFNTLRIHPLPEMLTAFEGIKLTGPTKEYASVTDWSGTEIEFTDENNIPLEPARKHTFRFETAEINRVSILLNNRNYTMLDSATKEFVIGARLISLENITYMNEGYIGLAIDCTDKAAISQIIPLYEGNPSNIEVYVFKTLDAFNSTESFVTSGNVSTIQSKPSIAIDGGETTVYILFKLLKHNNNTTPILKGCTIKWL